MDRFKLTKLSPPKTPPTPLSPQTSDSSGVQEFKNPFKDSARTRGVLDSAIEGVLKERVAKGDKKATKTLVKRRVARVNAQQAQAQVKPIAKAPEAFEFIAPTPDQEDEIRAVQANLYADQFNEEDRIRAKGDAFEAVTKVPDMVLGTTTVPGSGMVLSGLYRGLVKSATGVVGQVGAVYNDLGQAVENIAGDQGDDDPIKDIENFGDFLTALSKDVAEGIDGYEMKRPKGSKNWVERISEGAGELAGQLPKIVLLSKTLGAPVGFGVDRAIGARARGVEDRQELLEEFAQGAAEGALLNQLGKTADWLTAYKGTNPLVLGAKAIPKTSQVVAQGLGGLAQPKVDAMLHPDQVAPDAFDYMFSAATNMILDPVLFGSGPKGGPVTNRAIRNAKAEAGKFPGANLDLPTLSGPKNTIWSGEWLGGFTETLPMEPKVVSDLLSKAKVEFNIDDNVMYANPQAAAVMARVFQSLGAEGQSFLSSNGVMLDESNIRVITEGFEGYVNKLKSYVHGIDDPKKEPLIHQIVNSAIKAEAIAEQFSSAIGTDGMVLKFVRNATEPLKIKQNEIAAKATVGHEAFHIEQSKVAEAIGSNLYAITEPGWLVNHPLGAKLISQMEDLGDSHALKFYDNPATWTTEAMAFVAQPGDVHKVGLSTRERGVLLGDYMSHLAGVHGTDVVKSFDARWIDRGVAEVAFKQMAARNLVTLDRDYAGKPVGLIWKDIEVPRKFITPEGIEMSIAESKAVDPKKAGIDAIVQEKLLGVDKLGFRYNTGQIINKAMSGPMTGQQILSMLKNSGVRAGELEWTGLGNWLMENSGNKLTREDVANYLDSHRVDVEEVTIENGKYRKYTKASKLDYAEPKNYREVLLSLNDPNIFQPDIHWKNVLNVFGHYRLTDVDANGQKILRVDEIQSTNHQAGDKGGYLTPEATKEVTQLSNKIKQAEDQIIGQSIDLLDVAKWRSSIDNGYEDSKLTQSFFESRDTYFKSYKTLLTSIENLYPDFDQLLSRNTMPSLTVLSEVINELKRRINNVANAVDYLTDVEKEFGKGFTPELKTHRLDVAITLTKYKDKLSEEFTSAKPNPVSNLPFKKSWPELVLRRLVKRAVDEGYGEIEFVTGKESDAVSGGKSSWFYDKEIPKLARKIFEPLGAVVKHSGPFTDLIDANVWFGNLEQKYQAVAKRYFELRDRTRDTSDLTNDFYAEYATASHNYDTVYREMKKIGYTFDLNHASNVDPIRPLKFDVDKFIPDTLDTVVRFTNHRNHLLRTIRAIKDKYPDPISAMDDGEDWLLGEEFEQFAQEYSNPDITQEVMVAKSRLEQVISDPKQADKHVNAISMIRSLLMDKQAYWREATPLEERGILVEGNLQLPSIVSLRMDEKTGEAFGYDLDNRLKLELTPEFKARMSETPQILPFNLAQDPMDSVSASDEIGSEVIKNYVKDKAILFAESSATPEAKTQYDKLNQEHLEAKKLFNQLNSRIRAGAANLRYSKELAASGIDMAESIKAQLAELRQHQDSKIEVGKRLAESKLKLDDMWNEISAEINQNRQDVAKTVLEERTKTYTERIEAAAGRLKNVNGMIEIEETDPIYQEVMAIKTMHQIGRIGRDILIANKITVSDDVSLHRQLFDAVSSGFIDVAELDNKLQAQGSSLQELMENFVKAGSTFGKGLNVLSQIKKDLNKHYQKSPGDLDTALRELFKDLPAVESWFKGVVPTVRELRKQARGRNNAMRLLSIRNSAMLLTIGTQMTNAVQGVVAAGHRSLFNVAENIMMRMVGGKYDKVGTDGIAVEQEMQVPSIGSSFRPLIEIVNLAAAGARQVAQGDISWLDTGMRGRPNGKYGRTITLVEDLMKAFPDVHAKMVSSLEADFESMDLDAAGKALTIMGRQIDFMPEGEKKARLKKEFEKSQARLNTEGTKLSETLRAVEATMHKAMIIGRGPERILRTAIFAGQLDVYAQKYGQNIWELHRDKRAHEINPDAVGRALGDALEATFGLQARANAESGSTERMVADYMKFLRQGDNALSLALNAVQPFQNFLLQFSKYTFETSPLTLGRYLGLLLPSRREGLLARDGNYDKLAKGIVGTTAWTAAYLAVRAKYDEAEKNKKPNENPQWDSLLGSEASVRGTLWGPMFFLADQAERYRRGLNPGTKDTIEWLGNLGPDFRGIAGTFDWADKLYEEVFNGEGTLKDKTKEGIAKSLGAWVAAYATPLRNFTDFAGEFEEDQRTLKELTGWGYASGLTPFLDKLPSAIYTHTGARIPARELLEDRIDPFTGRPMMKNHPSSRALTGFTLIPETSYPAKVFATAGIRYGDWIPFTGIPEVDKEMIKGLGARAGRLTEAIQNTAIVDQDLDQQIRILYERYRELALEAKADALGKFPEIEMQMERGRELNKWEKNVIDKNRKLQGLPPVEDIYKQIKAEREAKKGKK